MTDLGISQPVPIVRDQKVIVHGVPYTPGEARDLAAQLTETAAQAETVSNHQAGDVFTATTGPLSRVLLAISDGVYLHTPTGRSYTLDQVHDKGYKLAHVTTDMGVPLGDVIRAAITRGRA